MAIPLYDINDRIEYILANCVDEDGAMTQETADMLDDLEEMREEKILNILLYYRGELLEAEAVEKEYKKLKTRADVHRNRAQWLKDYVSRNMDEGEKINDPRLKTHWRNTKVVEIDDADALPEQYVVIHTEERPDKTAIKKAIEDGTEVPGAHLETRRHLQIK